jgi:hypothetical protein
MKDISSPYTFFYKFVFIILWFFGFALGAREVLFFSEAFDNRWKQYMIVWLVITVCIYFMTCSIKRVRMDEKNLEISNYFRTETIPITEIADVAGSGMISPKTVWFDLKKECSFGDKIVFIPLIRFSPGLGQHPMVEELRQELKLEQKELFKL